MPIPLIFIYLCVCICIDYSVGRNWDCGAHQVKMVECEKTDSQKQITKWATVAKNETHAKRKNNNNGPRTTTLETTNCKYLELPTSTLPYTKIRRQRSAHLARLATLCGFFLSLSSLFAEALHTKPVFKADALHSCLWRQQQQMIQQPKW